MKLFKDWSCIVRQASYHILTRMPLDPGSNLETGDLSSTLAKSARNQVKRTKLCYLYGAISQMIRWSVELNTLHGVPAIAMVKAETLFVKLSPVIVNSAPPSKPVDRGQ